MIRFLVPNGTGALNPLQLNVNGAFSNTLMLAYEPPTIDDVSLKWQEDDQLAMWQIHAHPSFPDDGITDLHREVRTVVLGMKHMSYAQLTALLW